MAKLVRQWFAKPCIPGSSPGVASILTLHRSTYGRVVESADTTDLKSVDRKVLRVQVPPRLPDLVVPVGLDAITGVFASHG